MKRVISLLPSATEIIYAIGAEASLVGVTHECDYPHDATTKPKVTSARIDPSMSSDEIDKLVRTQLEDSGTLYALDLDLVRELRPDIVLTQQLCTVCAVGYATVRAAMNALPQPPVVINLEPRTLDDVFATFVTVGDYLGFTDSAHDLVDALRTELANIPRPHVQQRTVVLEWLHPPFRAGHWIPELIDAAGGLSVLDNRGDYSRGTSWEEIRASEPEAIVISCCGFSIERAMLDVESCVELQALRREHPSLRVIVIDGNHFFSRPGPRLVESARHLNEAIRGLSPTDVSSSVPAPYLILPAGPVVI